MYRSRNSADQDIVQKASISSGDCNPLVGASNVIRGRHQARPGQVLAFDSEGFRWRNTSAGLLDEAIRLLPEHVFRRDEYAIQVFPDFVVVTQDNKKK